MLINSVFLGKKSLSMDGDQNSHLISNKSSFLSFDVDRDKSKDFNCRTAGMKSTMNNDTSNRITNMLNTHNYNKYNQAGEIDTYRKLIMIIIVIIMVIVIIIIITIIIIVIIIIITIMRIRIIITIIIIIIIITIIMIIIIKIKMKYYY